MRVDHVVDEVVPEVVDAHGPEPGYLGAIADGLVAVGAGGDGVVIAGGRGSCLRPQLLLAGP